MIHHYYSKAHRRRIGKVFTNTHSLFLAGGNEYVNIDAVRTALATTTVGTWSCWVKPVDATPIASEFFISFGDADALEDFMFYITLSGQLTFISRVAGVMKWRLRTDGVALSNNIWGHIAIVQDGTEPKLYVDGTVVAQTFQNDADKTTWFNNFSGLDNGRIGNRNFNGGGETDHYNGNIDEVRFWNIALTAEQVLAEYNSGCPKAPLETGLVSSFRIDGDTVPTMRDDFGSNDGIYVNVVQNEIQTVVVC